MRKSTTQKKTLALLDEIEAIWTESMDAFRQHRTWARARRLGLCQLACLGRHTIASLICAGGRQGDDWSADYRLFARDKWNVDDLFRPVLRGALQMLPDNAPLVVAMDDTRLRKTGRKIPGVGYGRDPMSPPFHVNLVLGQRFVQLSAMIPAGSAPSSARGVPVRWRHCPPVAKPRYSADEHTWKMYRKKRREKNLSTCGRDEIKQCRYEMDNHHHARNRRLVMVFDGSYTNKAVLRDLPDRTTVIGRIRKDAKLHHPPCVAQQLQFGRKRLYGDVALTPEAMRTDDSIPWQSVKACASGRMHTFRVKEMKPVLWRKAGADLPVRIVVIAPTRYRLNKTSRFLYRQPAFLLSTDLDMPVEELLQYYIWRWDIEVNHRDEKQLIGVGQAQVWSPQSVERQPAFAVASYAYLLLAALRVYGINGERPDLPIPKWQKGEDTPGRISTQKLLQELRSEVWAYATERLEKRFGDATERLDRSFDDFVNNKVEDTKYQKLEVTLETAAIMARAG